MCNPKLFYVFSDCAVDHASRDELGGIPEEEGQQQQQQEDDGAVVVTAAMAASTP